MVGHNLYIQYLVVVFDLPFGDQLFKSKSNVTDQYAASIFGAKDNMILATIYCVLGSFVLFLDVFNFHMVYQRVLGAIDISFVSDRCYSTAYGYCQGQNSKAKGGDERRMFFVELRASRVADQSPKI